MMMRLGCGGTYHLLRRLQLFEFGLHLRYLILGVLARFVGVSESVLDLVDFKLVLCVLRHQLFFLFHVPRKQALCVGQRVLQLRDLD